MTKSQEQSARQLTFVSFFLLLMAYLLRGLRLCHTAMKKNMGNTDCALRPLLATTIAVLFSLRLIDGLLGAASLYASGAFAITSLLGYCPMYASLGISTYHPKEKHTG